VKRLLVDTGPLVAFLSREDAHHAWVTRAWRVRAEFVTCEAVIAEAAFLLRRRAGAVDLLFQFLEEASVGVVALGAELATIRRLIRQYVSVPMSFADACLVRMSELHPRAVVTTCDSDFQVYRRLGRQVIPLLAPFSS
jgi:predicted nucleic acid-binding protein